MLKVSPTIIGPFNELHSFFLFFILAPINPNNLLLENNNFTSQCDKTVSLILATPTRLNYDCAPSTTNSQLLGLIQDPL